MGWVPCPLSPPPAPPTKSSVSLDPKTFEADGGGMGVTVCLKVEGELKQPLSNLRAGTWFSLEITRTRRRGRGWVCLLRVPLQVEAAATLSKD